MLVVLIKVVSLQLNLIFYSYLLEGEVAGSKSFLDFSITTLLRRIDGRSKSVQDAFECKLFHVGPSDFPEFFFLFRFNCGDFLLFSGVPSLNRRFASLNVFCSQKG